MNIVVSVFFFASTSCVVAQAFIRIQRVHERESHPGQLFWAVAYEIANVQRHVETCKQQVANAVDLLRKRHTEYLCDG